MSPNASIVNSLLAVILSGIAFAADVNKQQSAAASEWPNWRGPNHNGISTEKGWLTEWPKGGLKELWKAELGRSHSSVAVMAGKVYAMGRNAEQDTVLCLNAETGATAWKHSYPAAESDYGGGPRATPAVDGKAVYALSADGQAFCLDAASGQVIWNKNLQKELNLVMPLHNFSSSPVLEGELLLANMGTSGLALDKKTGNVVWKSAGDSGYSSPVPFTLAGKRCVALFAATQLAVVDLANGQKMASYEWRTMDNANCADPVIVGDAIFITSSYGRGCALIGVSGGNAAVMWKKGLECHYASPVLVGDCLYALFGSGWLRADLVCVSAKDGSVRWRRKDVGSGGLMVADGKLIVLSRGGDLILAEASPTAYAEIARAKIFSADACWNSPVLCDGRIYARNEKGTLVCLDVRGK
ncbi:MAG: PQQ-binding-like beta-propeller repeat protein [Thermoguttaceae bacterium]|jgi:outer membrane protein assembly factor BamB